MIRFAICWPCVTVGNDRICCWYRRLDMNTAATGFPIQCSIWELTMKDETQVDLRYVSPISGILWNSCLSFNRTGRPSKSAYCPWFDQSGVSVSTSLHRCWHLPTTSLGFCQSAHIRKVMHSKIKDLGWLYATALFFVDVLRLNRFFRHLFFSDGKSALSVNRWISLRHCHIALHNCVYRFDYHWYRTFFSAGLHDKRSWRFDSNDQKQHEPPILGYCPVCLHTGENFESELLMEWSPCVPPYQLSTAECPLLDAVRAIRFFDQIIALLALFTNIRFTAMAQISRVGWDLCGRSILPFGNDLDSCCMYSEEGQ